ncbi:hypothetical protein F0562_015006 [Nyssa sinensis]|uniref:Uncharacterized protein n=1 Tax=Nyssa sinensis TaxID=561372 RepID=A0A5J4ZTK3_9ASTE|nr:hypothetical protein F0562_015006 [Nyssa sinensis]
MSEPAKVRLVRCPKCENLLPELTNYSVYQCGGCGAVLQAKNRNVDADTCSEKSYEETVGAVSEKFSNKSENFNFSEREMVKLSDGSENDVKSNGSFSSRAENGEVLGDNNDISEKYRNGSKIKTDKWVIENDPERNENLDESSHANMGKAFEELKLQNGNTNGSQILGQISDGRIGERSGMEGFRRKPRMDVEGVRYSTSKYSEDGPSNFHSGSSYGYGEPVKNGKEPDVFNKVEQDRAELLRKLNELKDQLSRTCDVNDKAKEKVPLDRRMAYPDPYGGSENWFPDGSSKASMQYSMPDRHVARPPCVHNYPEPSPFLNRHEMAMHGFYPSFHTSSQLRGMVDPLSSQMLRAVPHQAPDPFQQQPSHPYYSGHYIDNKMVPFEPYPHNVNLHPPSCSCFHCYSKHRQVPAPVSCPPSAFGNKMFPDVPNNPMFYHHEHIGAFGPCDCNPRIANPPPMNFHNPQSHTRWHSDLNSEVGSFVRRNPSRVVLATGGRRCRPIAGGAPFVMCYNCFELLQLPKKVLPLEKNQKKMQCGACSAAFLFAIVNNKLVVSVHAETKRTPTTTEFIGGPNMAVNGTSHSHGHRNQASMNFSSDDYDNSGYDFQSMDREPTSLSTGQGLSSSKPAEMRSFHSSSPCTSEDDDSPDSSISTNHVTNSAELNLSPPPPGSLLQDHADYSSKYCGVNRFGKGNQSGRSDRENMISKKVTSRQNSMKDASQATEMEVSFNEYNTGVSLDSGDTSREEDQSRANKGAESFFASIIKKSFRDFSRSNQNVDRGRSNVTVNGHPIPDRLVKKAGKLAGPVHPGQYWYDFRAGFWGLMGGPCLGIIPPFIEEFNYPMPENCAGGNTGVFVNGRELHQKDLDLLGSRGLPTTRDRSYIIEISGRVLDEDSGEELDSLGKLAPTIERVRRGFGMKVPRAAA